MRPAMMVLALALPSLLRAQAPRVDPMGRHVVLYLDDRAHTSFRGELLAAAGDSAWVLTEGTGQIQAVPLAVVGEASVRRHNMKPLTGFLWGLGVGVVSGIALTAACSSVEDASCSSVLPVFAANGMLFGGLAAISYGSSNRWHFTHVRADSLARFARFPQGPPAGASLEQLLHPATDTTLTRPPTASRE